MMGRMGARDAMYPGTRGLRLDALMTALRRMRALPGDPSPDHFARRRPKRRNPTFSGWGFCSLLGSLTITYFHTGNPHYHRRGVVSRSCSGWEGVGPTRYGHQA